MAKSVLKMLLIGSLDEKEKIAFAFLLSKVQRPLKSRESVLEYLKNSETKTLFGFLHREIFGGWGYTKLAMNKVLDNLDRVRRVLGAVSVDSSFLKGRVLAGDICPKMPEDLTINNGNIGDVFVTIHAWKQFWSRFCQMPSQSELAKKLMRSFVRAVPTKLKKGYSALRIIRNEFKPACYFFDQELGCRFVVISEDNKKVLLTIEHPRP